MNNLHLFFLALLITGCELPPKKTLSNQEMEDTFKQKDIYDPENLAKWSQRDKKHNGHDTLHHCTHSHDDDKEYISYHYSASREYFIKEIFKSLPDVNKGFKHILYFNNSSQNDSIELQDSYVHDSYIPVYFWNEKNKQLVYEKGGEESRKIIVLDLVTRKTVFDKGGIINAEEDVKWNYYDSLNNVILFFRQTDRKKYRSFQMIKLNLDILEEKVIDSLQTSDDPITGYPWIKHINYKKRKAIVRSNDFMVGKDSLIVNY